jgi:hypothetical protein
MKHLLLSTIFLFHVSLALAQSPSVGPVDTRNLGNATITATGGSTARTLADRAADLVNVKDGYGGHPGAKGDGKISSPVVNITNGSSVLTVGSSLFSASDVGKSIIIANAGVAPTSGPVVATPVSSQGGGYASVPTCAVTDGAGTGSGATCAALMTIQSATVSTAGLGCTAGTQIFQVAIDAVGTQAQFTGTVTSGTLSGTLTITSPGLMTAMGATTSVPAYGANCSTAPTVNLSYGVGAVQVTAQGASYSTSQTTAALSGGTPTTAAVMGTPLIGAPIPPLKTTIASYTSPTQITLTDTASTTISGVATQIMWATDDTVAIQNAINAAIGKAGGVWLPAGLYWLGARLDPSVGNLTFRGEGPSSTILMWDASLSVGQGSPTWTPAFGNTGVSRANMRGSLQFEDMQFRGTLDFGRVNMGAAALELNFYKEISFDRVKIYQAPNMAMALEGIDTYRVQNSVFDTVMRDQARCRSCFNAIIRGNSFFHSDDDSVALHQANYIQGAGNIREGMVVEDNTFEDTTCIHILGARSAIIRANILRRCKVNAITVSTDAGEGVNQMRGITIADNIITDVTGRPPFISAMGAAIGVGVSAPAAPSGLTQFYPGAQIQGTTFFGKPWDFDLNVVNGTTAYAPAARGVIIRGNQVMRTLPATTAYSSWGFGKAISSAGFLDLPVPDGAFVPNSCITASANINMLNIANNAVQDCRRGISLVDNISVASQTSISISFNQIFNTWEYGIVGFGSGNVEQMDIIGNQVNVDPYHISPGRSGGHGGWTSGYSASQCLGMGYIHFGQVRFNTFSECYAIADSTNWHVSDNIVRGSYYSGSTGQLGYTTANYGIGSYPVLAGNRYWVHNVTADPTNGTPANYGVQSSNRTPAYAAAAPTSGSGVIGDTIWSSNPSACSCMGWQRLTTGTAWVAGTDYKVLALQ